MGVERSMWQEQAGFIKSAEEPHTIYYIECDINTGRPIKP